jgi:UDP-N-acetyl-D-galactosamine dehydrogenase
LDTLARIYGAVVHAGIHRAPSIKVAETAKVIENTQRDINIALMNELATICEKLDIRTSDVLSAACTKWNFLPFSPGLVGGHCIGVDPYYLTTKAEELGYHAEVILAGRRINDGMGPYIAQKLVKLLIQEGIQVKGARVAILGLTFKENVKDLRNSKVPDIVRELAQFGITPLVSDPMAETGEAYEEYGIELVDNASLADLDAAILAVPHAQFLAIPPSDLTKGLRRPSVFVDVKSALAPGVIPPGIRYWSL